MADIREMGQSWLAQGEEISHGDNTPGHFEAGVEEGIFVALFEGEGLIVDEAGLDGGGSLRKPFGNANLGLEKLIPQQARLTKNPHTGEIIPPTHQAAVRVRVETVLTPLDWDEEQRKDNVRWREWVLSQDRLGQERGEY